MAMTKMDCAKDSALALLESLPMESMTYILNLLDVGSTALEILGEMDIDLTDLDGSSKKAAKALVAEWDTRIKAGD